MFLYCLIGCIAFIFLGSKHSVFNFYRNAAMSYNTILSTTIKICGLMPDIVDPVSRYIGGYIEPY